MGVIDHHQRLRATAQALHAPGRAFKLRQHLENFVQGVIQTEQRTDRRQDIAQVEATEQGAAQVVLALWRDQRGAHAFVVELRLTAIQVGAGVFQAVGDQPRLALVGGQLPAELVVEVDHAAFQVIPVKQPGLGFAVGLHGAVIIQVIAGQVGHHCHIERQGSHAPLIQAMGRNFHRHGLGPGLFQVRQGRLHGNRVRRGVQAAFQRPIETRTERADQAAVLAEQVQRLGDQLSHAGLAVGTGHAHQVQVMAWLAIKTPGDVRQLSRQTFDRNQRHFSDRQDRGAFYFIGHRGSTTLQGVNHMRAPIEFPARHSEEQITRTHIAAVQGEFANQQIVAGVRENLVQAQGHQPRPPLAFSGTTGVAFAC
ncbi:hypothetical protein D3C76_917670 [compost metagenome]